MDRVLFQMPNDPHEFLIALSVVQGYIFEYAQEINYGMRTNDFQFVYRMDEKFSKYEAPLKVIEANTPNFDYFGWTQFSRSEFSNFIDFDFERAKNLALKSGKRLVEAMGILYGCTPRRWPILLREPAKKGIAIVSLGDGVTEKLLSLIPGSLVPESDPENYDTVIAPLSDISYLAATHCRKLVEIFPDVESYVLHNSESLFYYQAVIGHPPVSAIVNAWMSLTPEVDYALLDTT